MKNMGYIWVEDEDDIDDSEDYQIKDDKTYLDYIKQAIEELRTNPV